MGTEIERKFLVVGDGWRGKGDGKLLQQGYLCFGPPVAVRVRMSGEHAVLNMKKASLSITRDEFEYAIPCADGAEILAKLCEGSIIEKTRYEVKYKGMIWEVDEFHGANAGLIIAEIELSSEEQTFEKPAWVGEEVSAEPRYLNTHLSRRPYSTW